MASEKSDVQKQEGEAPMHAQLSLERKLTFG